MKLINSFVATLLVPVIIISSCKKTTQPQPVCTISGIYTGTYTNQLGQSATFAFSFKANNLVVNAPSISSLNSPTAAGSYTNNCDSIFVTMWSPTNNNYYKFSGKILNNQSQITGTYLNQTTPSETGPFQLSKQ